MSIGSRIKQRRIELGLTQPALAKLLDVSKGTVGNYECDISAPNEKILYKIFDVLKCDANYLYQDNMVAMKTPLFSEAETKHIAKYRALDWHGKDIVDTILDKEYDRYISEQEEPEDENRFTIRHSFYKASAGTGVYLPDDDNDWDEIEVPDTPEARKADYALTIQGDSMEPVYFDGDIVLVEQCETIDRGQIGIFVVDGEGYIKKFGGDRLISLNDKYNDIEFGEYTEYHCMGRVIGRISR